MPESRDTPYGEQTIHVGIDRKRRKGKTVTVASGFRLTAKTLDKVAKQLKQRCAAGGKSSTDDIEIQGDHVETVIDVLTKIGFKVR